MTIECCPTCERDFKTIKDYPKVYVASVSTITAEEVPTALPSWRDEKLEEEVSPGNHHPYVPYYVLKYFQEQSDQKELAHTDNYIYESPYPKIKEWEEQKITDPERYSNVHYSADWRRHFNWSSIVKSVLTTSTSLIDYLNKLKNLEGSEIPTNEIFPPWDQYHLPAIPAAPLGYKLSETESSTLQFNLPDR